MLSNVRLFAAAAFTILFSFTVQAQNPAEVAVPPDAPAGATGAGDAAPQQHPTATVYSPGYETRLKIHKIASYATIPLFATELWLGQSLYNDPLGEQSKRGAHIAVGTGIIGLFGVNTVTGLWNLRESRNDPEGKKLRILHSVLMMIADGGFVATAATGPHGARRGFPAFPVNAGTHRALAFSSIGVGTAGYAIMLFGGR